VVGMDTLYKRVKDVKDFLGTPIKEVTQSEIAIRKKLRG